MNKSTASLSEIDENDLIAERRVKLNQTKNNTGKLFCLVPLVNTTFPFKVYLDADWHMNKERTDLSNDTEAINWHTEMISETFPDLIKQYLLSDKEVDADETQNPYGFIGNLKKPFTIITWLTINII